MHLRQLVLVRIANLLEDGCSGLCCWGLAVLHVEQPELILNDIGDRLRVRCGS